MTAYREIYQKKTGFGENIDCGVGTKLCSLYNINVINIVNININLLYLSGNHHLSIKCRQQWEI